MEQSLPSPENTYQITGDTSVQAGELRACCRIEENLEVKPTDKTDLVLRQCKVCNARHWELNVDKGELGLVMT